MFEATAVFATGGLGQVAVPAGQHHGAQQERLHARGEDGVARLDGVAAIAQLMRQTNLPRVGMAALSGVEVGDPDRWPVPVHHFGHDAGTTATADHMDCHLGILEHPVPAAMAVNAHAGLV